MSRTTNALGRAVVGVLEPLGVEMLFNIATPAGLRTINVPSMMNWSKLASALLKTSLLGPRSRKLPHCKTYSFKK